MKKESITNFVSILHKTHRAEWEATPLTDGAIGWLNELIQFLFPNNYLPKEAMYEGILKKSQADLENILLSYLDADKINAEELADSFYSSLDTIYQDLRQDAARTFEYDPAASSVHEVIVSYPGFYAIAVYRIANRLTQLNIPVLPRILSEYAHSKTGIDIHPNAQIGVPFVIDHGTGIVIGATSIIGKNVIIYQGVTLGALYVNKQLSEVKRHPTVEDDVIIYARTTILGGGTVIGQNSIIGGSVFLTQSVEPNSSVFNTHQLRITSKKDTYNGHKVKME